MTNGTPAVFPEKQCYLCDVPLCAAALSYFLSISFLCPSFLRSFLPQLQFDLKPYFGDDDPCCCVDVAAFLVGGMGWRLRLRGRSGVRPGTLAS